MLIIYYSPTFLTLRIHGIHTISTPTIYDILHYYKADYFLYSHHLYIQDLWYAYHYDTMSYDTPHYYNVDYLLYSHHL